MSATQKTTDKNVTNRDVAKQVTSGGASGTNQRTQADQSMQERRTKEDQGDEISDYYRYGQQTLNTGNSTIEQGYPAKTLVPNEPGPASIRVMRQDGGPGTKEVSIMPMYTKFILESVQEAHQERHQIIETFGDFYVFFFGEAPPIYNFSGLLINAQNVNWAYEWQHYYENTFRGTKCAERNAKVKLDYADLTIEGFILSFSTQRNAITEAGIPIQFSMVLTKRSSSLKPDDFNLNGKEQERIASLIKFYNGGITGKDSSKPLSAEAWDHTNKAMQGGPASQFNSSSGSATA